MCKIGEWGGSPLNAGLLLLLPMRLRSDRYRHTRRPHLPERGHNKTKAQKTRRAAATGGRRAALRERNEYHMIGNHTGGQKAGRSPQRLPANVWLHAMRSGQSSPW